MLKKVFLCVLYFALLAPLTSVVAEEEEGQQAPDYQYFALSPDIITNYIKPGKRLGYVRLRVDLMVKSSTAYEQVEMNAPLIRDRIITIFGEQNESQIKSNSERDAIRQRCLTEVNDVLFEFIGTRPVENLLFTKYLEQ
ncbi:MULTISPECIES: flagellar basal body-associated FliL family protein [Psychromonas]|uniref:flagellar basal body-associated FliL family protein n=1 Tax=Psychromonas TaxID=67572 RepID=UPI0004180295|nr:MULTISPECIES: flagellar basal body-associated FliL family protein [Psychromonas]MBB1271449.1 flagellar basal body-associated protein FliL [Psychromonas sp. SR45-3]